MYTSEAAKIVYREDVQGQIKEGYFADFIVLDRDVMKVEANELKETKVLKQSSMEKQYLRCKNLFNIRRY